MVNTHETVASTGLDNSHDDTYKLPLSLEARAGGEGWRKGAGVSPDKRPGLEKRVLATSPVPAARARSAAVTTAPDLNSEYRNHCSGPGFGRTRPRDWKRRPLSSPREFGDKS